MELLIIPSEERVEGVKKMKAWVVLAIMSLLTAGLTTPALAAKPANPNCWGVVTSQRATTLGDIGEHASSQDVPRLGLGNVARLFVELGLLIEGHVSDLGTFLAEIDGIAATECP